MRTSLGCQRACARPPCADNDTSKCALHDPRVQPYPLIFKAPHLSILILLQNRGLIGATPLFINWCACLFICRCNSRTWHQAWATLAGASLLLCVNARVVMQCSEEQVPKGASRCASRLLLCR